MTIRPPDSPRHPATLRIHEKLTTAASIRAHRSWSMVHVQPLVTFIWIVLFPRAFAGEVGGVAHVDAEGVFGVG